MFADAFAYFLLEKGLISDKQAKEVLAKRVLKVRPAVAAVYAKLLTEPQAKTLAELQFSLEMPFGFLAVREGFLTNGQANDLEGIKTKDDMRIMQTLSDKEIMSMNYVLENLERFKEYYGLNDDQYCGIVANKPEYYVACIGGLNCENDIFAKYASVFIETFIRCIDSSVRIEKARNDEIISDRYVFTVKLSGDKNMLVGMALDETAINLSGRFAKQKQREFDEDAEDSVKEFLNTVSGLLATRLEHEMNIGVELDVPELRPGGVYANESIGIMEIYSSDINAKIFLAE